MESGMFLTSFGAYGTVPLISERLTVGMPPFIIVDGVLDLNFGPFLMIDQLIIDDLSLEKIYSLEIPSFRHLKKSLHILENEGPKKSTEGFIKRVDYGKIQRKYKTLMANAIEIELREPTKWLPEIRHNKHYWCQSQTELTLALGKHYDPLLIGSSFGVVSCLKECGEPISQSNVRRLEKLIDSKRKQRNHEDIDMLRRIVRPYLEEVYINIAIKTELGIPFLDQEGRSFFYETFYNTALRKMAEESLNASHEMAKIEELFSLGLPDFRPRSSSHLIRLLRDKRIESIRGRVREAMECGEKLDAEWGKRELTASNFAQMEFGRATRRFIPRVLKQIASALSLPYPLGDIAQKSVDALVSIDAKAAMNQSTWLFCLIDANEAEKQSVNSILKLQ